jgi:RND family efflux transporter MFP subunit
MKKILKNKIVLIIIAVAVAGGGYWWHSRSTVSVAPQYVTAKAAKGTLVVSVSGSGQVAAFSQIDIKPKVSAEVVRVSVAPGAIVHAGQTIIVMDDTDAKRAVVNAQQSLVEAKLQHQKDTAQAPIDYQKALDALSSDKEDLQTEYNDTFNVLSNTYLDLPDVMTGMDDILYGNDVNPKGDQWNVDVLLNLFSDKDTTSITALAKSAENDYGTASGKYDESVLVYKGTNRSSGGDALESVLAQSIDALTAITQAAQAELNFLGGTIDLATQYNRTLPTAVKTMQSQARSYLTTANNDLAALLSQKKTIDASKQSITTDNQNIALLQVGNPAGDNPISLQISKNSIANQEDNLAQLQDALADYTVIAPFDGTISAVNVKVGDTASGAVATIISSQNLARATFNETDIVNVKVGQPVTITFDALPDLALTGKVSVVDTVGTVSQGVVSYGVQVALDMPNASVKPGMSDSIAIITNVKQDVLLVPNSAVSTKQGVSSVQTMGSSGVPQETQVTIGLSNDTMTEIVSGLNEGDTVVTQTITKSATAAVPTAARTTGGLGGFFGGGGGGR